MIVYLVRQTQPREYYETRTIYVCSTKERARDYARKLNKQYGYGVKFNQNYDFIDFDEKYDYDSQHYYDIETIEVDKPLAPFLT